MKIGAMDIKRHNKEWQDRFAHFSEQIIATARKQPDHIIVICGPTASGKSSLALTVAKALRGIILSADSMQIYRGFDIGTAKPTKAEQVEVPHKMIDILDPDQNYSVALFAEDAGEILSNCQSKQVPVIVCGGTGQYISTLLDGIDYSAHSRNLKLRAEIEREVEAKGLEYFWNKLQRLDPEAAQTMAATDKRRIIRFHEQFRLTGKTRTEINRESKLQTPDFNYSAFYLDPGREILNYRIEKRCRQMLDAGLIEETKNLLLSYPDTSLQPYRGIGYREVLNYLDNRYSKIELEKWIVIHTRQYAKRQSTWFRPRTDLIRFLFNQQ